jgi:hypothetical protein
MASLARLERSRARINDRTGISQAKLPGSGHLLTRLPVCIPKNNCRSANLRSAHESFSQSSHPFECGAVRFFLWWLFLHLRLRSENVSSACAEPFAPFGGSVQRVPLVFIRMAWEDLSAFPSKAFRLRLRASIESTDRCWFPLPCVTTSVADPFVGLEGRAYQSYFFFIIFYLMKFASHIFRVTFSNHYLN